MDRNQRRDFKRLGLLGVALRKESVDRNAKKGISYSAVRLVALRKESVDRNEKFEGIIATKE